MPNFGIPDRDLLDRINRLEATVNELSRAHGAPITAIRDANGAELVQADPLTGVALQRPYIPIPFRPDVYLDWPRTIGTTVETSDTRLWRCDTLKQHPAIVLHIVGLCSASTTGSAKFWVNNEQLWPDIPFVAGNRQAVKVGPIPLPGEFLAPMTMLVTGALDTVSGTDPAMWITVSAAYGVELREPIPYGS